MKSTNLSNHIYKPRGMQFRQIGRDGAYRKGGVLKYVDRETQAFKINMANRQTGGWLRHQAGLPVQVARKLGYSDIRLWPCYIVLCLATFGMAPWLGMFWAFILGGVPAFVLGIIILGVNRKHSTIPDRWRIPLEIEVFRYIDIEDKKFNRQNKLLRRNMKIIQSDKKDLKNLKKKSRGLRRAKTI